MEQDWQPISCGNTPTAITKLHIHSFSLSVLQVFVEGCVFALSTDSPYLGTFLVNLKNKKFFHVCLSDVV